MAACYLSTVPPELVLHIIDACASTRDALAFTATCHAMFRLGRGYVVDRFWADTEPTFPCIEEALIAVRPSCFCWRAGSSRLTTNASRFA